MGKKKVVDRAKLKALKGGVSYPTGLKGSEVDSGFKSGYEAHDKECEMLTFLYVMGKGWHLIDGEDIKTVIREVGRRGDKYLKAALEERICACGSPFLQHGRVPGPALQVMGENLGVLMRELLGEAKGLELLAKMSEQDAIQDDENA